MATLEHQASPVHGQEPSHLLGCSANGLTTSHAAQRLSANGLPATFRSMARSRRRTSSQLAALQAGASASRDRQRPSLAASEPVCRGVLRVQHAHGAAFTHKTPAVLCTWVSTSTTQAIVSGLQGAQCIRPALTHAVLPNQSLNLTLLGIAPGPRSRAGYHRPHGPGPMPLRAS